MASVGFAPWSDTGKIGCEFSTLMVTSLMTKLLLFEFSESKIMK